MNREQMRPADLVDVAEKIVAAVLAVVAGLGVGWLIVMAICETPASYYSLGGM